MWEIVLISKIIIIFAEIIDISIQDNTVSSTWAYTPKFSEV